MPVPPETPIGSEGLYRFAGMYGSAWRDGRFLGDVTEVSGAIEVQRIEVPIVGATKQGYKPGRESREGTMRVQKFDSAWEYEVFQFLSQSLETRRANRDAGIPSIRPFNLKIQYDDPDALGKEAWQLNGVLIWRLPLGFSITDDLVDREYPITWESETPLALFQKGVGPNGVPVAVPYVTT